MSTLQPIYRRAMAGPSMSILQRLVSLIGNDTPAATAAAYQVVPPDAVSIGSSKWARSRSRW